MTSETEEIVLPGRWRWNRRGEVIKATWLVGGIRPNRHVYPVVVGTPAAIRGVYLVPEDVEAKVWVMLSLRGRWK